MKLQAHQSAAAGGARGRGRRLHVPRHADPPARLIAVASDVSASQLPVVRAARAGGAAGTRARDWAERSGQDEPARGDSRRDAGVLAAHTHGRAARALRRRGRSRGGRGPPRRGGARDRADDRARRGRSARGSNGAPLRAAEQLRARRRTLVFTPDRLGVVKGAPAVAARVLRPRRSAASLPARATPAGRVRRCGRAAERRAAPRCRRLLESLRQSSRGRERVADARRGTRDEPARSARRPRPRVRRAGRTSSVSAAAAASLRGRASDPRGARRSFLTRDLERGMTVARPAPRRRASSHPSTAISGASARRGNSDSRSSRCCSPRPKRSTTRSGVPPLLLLDDVLSELDPARRRILAERVRGAGQALITATDRRDAAGGARSAARGHARSRGLMEPVGEGVREELRRLGAE